MLSARLGPAILMGLATLLAWVLSPDARGDPALAQALPEFADADLVLFGPVESAAIRALAVGDYDGDGLLDLLAASAEQHGLYAARGRPHAQGETVFDDFTSIGWAADLDLRDAELAAGTVIGTKTAADPADGADDVVVLFPNGRLTVFVGGPDFFRSATPRAPIDVALPQPPLAGSRLAVADMDADGSVDIAYASPAPAGGVTLVTLRGPFRADGGNALQTATVDRIGGPADFAAVFRFADLDADGLPDLVAVRRDASGAWQLVSWRLPPRLAPDVSVDALEPLVAIDLPRAPSDIAVGDVDADGRPDLVVGDARINQVAVVPAFALARPGATPPGAAPLERFALEIRHGPVGASLGVRLVAGDYDDDGLGDLLGTAPGVDRPLDGGMLVDTGAVVGIRGADRPAALRSVHPLALPRGRLTTVTIWGTRLADAEVFLRTASGARRQGRVVERSLGRIVAELPTPSLGDSAGLEVVVDGRSLLLPALFRLVAPARTVTLRAGWNLIGWTGPPAVVPEPSAIAPAADAVFRWDGAAQAWDVRRSGSPLPGGAAPLARGAALWVHTTGPGAWEQPVATGRHVLSLAPGANLVTWTGPEGTPLSDALAPIAPDLRVAFLYRPGADRYEAWAPGLPGADDPRLGFGQPLWLMVDRAVAWPVPAANAPPAVTSPQAASGSVVFIDAGREGSGFVIEDNLVVTAAHIVRGRREVRVRFPTGDEVSAAVVAADAPLDVALLSVPRVPDGTPRLAWLTGAQPALAEAVWLWGYPLGDPFGASTQPTVALGIVSAFQHNARGFPVIQTDAASAPGNSGGPLLDEGGRVIGVLISFVTRQGQDVEGINLTADVGANAGRLRELLARAWPDALAN